VPFFIFKINNNNFKKSTIIMLEYTTKNKIKTSNASSNTNRVGISLKNAALRRNIFLMGEIREKKQYNNIVLFSTFFYIN